MYFFVSGSYFLNIIFVRFICAGMHGRIKADLSLLFCPHSLRLTVVVKKAESHRPEDFFFFFFGI